MSPMLMASIVSLAAGAVVANVISVVLLIADAVNLRR
jgi:Ca2+/H+ antiporter, TMEM165/GDT1 family